MGRAKQKRVAEVEIERFSSRGNGLGSYQHPQGMQWKLEVPFTMPGDVVKVSILKKRRGAYQCLLEEVLKPSNQRMNPKCLHFASCGGCRWQHLSYEHQLTVKELFVKDCFKNILSPMAVWHPILPSVEAWEYRNKMEFSFSSNLKGEKFLGLMLDAGKGRVLNLTECHLVHPWFIDALKSVRQWWKESSLDAYRPPKDSGSLRTLIVREGFRKNERLVMLTVSGNPEYVISQQQLQEFVSAVRSAVEPINEGNLSIFLRIQQIAKGRPTDFYEMALYGSEGIHEVLHINQKNEIEALNFMVSPSAFFQPNTYQAEQLYSRVLALGEFCKDDVVYDLYCGTGTVGICLSKHVKEVIGIELSAESAVDAKNNVILNDLSNVKIIMGDVGDCLKKMNEESGLPKPDVVVVDPPRAGLDAEALRLIIAMNPMKIVYISCNPATQASNCEELVRAGYCLKVVQPVDQFPQTIHVENIAILSKDPTS